ncbi:MAG: flagellar FlbD family protein [Oscillospiraceae bacterium]|jgi:flagellar protein FlbD|nr:flagellar FlbD family protein [Oscillospiraceae bacterium]
MILVTRINKVEQFYVNENEIEFMEETPDTVISMVSGKKLMVMERAELICQRIREEKAKVYLEKLNYRPYVAPEPEWEPDQDSYEY